MNITKKTTNSAIEVITELAKKDIITSSESSIDDIYKEYRGKMNMLFIINLITDEQNTKLKKDLGEFIKEQKIKKGIREV